MVTKLSIKQRLRLFILAMLISIITIQSPLTVYADDLVGVVLDALGYNSNVSTTTIKNGVSWARTGYLCYLLKAEGGSIPGMTAKAFNSSVNTSDLPGSIWRCNSKQVPTGGAYSASGWTAVAPWSVTPFNEDKSTNVEKIREWTRGMTGSVQNGVAFVSNNWGEEVATHFYNGEYVLVIETILNFQFSDKVSGGSSFEITRIEVIDILRAKYGAEYVSGIPGDMIDLIVYEVNNTLSASAGGGWATVGVPLIGTCADFLDYYHQLEDAGLLTKNYFSKYTNNIAPFAEMIYQGEAGEKAGFVAWTGGTSSNLSDSAVPNYGVATMVLKATADMQTTCDEPQAGTPHDPPEESKGKVTIVKSYRDKINNVYTHKATTHRSNLGTQILIENEKEYQVVEWVTSSTTNTGVKGYVWSPPVAGVSQRGTTPTSVTLSPTEKCLYVLLEKVEEEPEEEKPYNYKLTQSMITRRVWFSNPDDRLTNMTGKKIIENYGFAWRALPHAKCGGHTFMNDCDGRHTQSCSEAGCSEICSSGCTDPHHEDTCLDGCMKQHEHEKCKHQL